MGYLTTYELSYEGPVVGEKAIIDTLSSINHYQFGDCLDVYDIYELFWEPMKWYDHDADMIELSKEFPDQIFCLEGRGEEFPDFWIHYYHNGKMKTSVGQIVYESVDLSNWED